MRGVAVVKTVLWFMGFGIYMLISIIGYLKLMYITRKGDKASADRYAFAAASKWGHFVINTVGAKVEIVGKEKLPKENCLFVANHQGYLDIPVFLAKMDRPLGFIAKKQLEKAPILSGWMKGLKCVFMDRDNIREAIKSINEGIEILKSGHSIVIFPEGTRSKSSNIGEFKKGSVKLAIKAGVPIVPVSINGTFQAFEEHNRIRSCNVKVVICDPIYIDELSREEQNNLAEITRSVIEANLK
jgi:1-acyl-sn-glycerol-3-phosphate acyltransferase